MLAQRLLALATATGQLSGSQIRLIGAALDAIDRGIARRAALQSACRALDAGQELSRWALAQRLERALKRFEGSGLKRVLSGSRPPNELEVHLLVLMESGPRCASKLWKEIRDLPARG